MPPVDRDAVILLDTFLPNPGDARRRARLERAVSFAATLADHLLADQYLVTLRAYGPDPVSLELEPRPPNEARIVWEWHVWDHLLQANDPNAAGYAVPSEHPGRLDVNGDKDAPVIDEKELEQLISEAFGQ